MLSCLLLHPVAGTEIWQFWACLLEIFDSSELVSSKYLTVLSLSPRNIWQFWTCLLEIFDSSELVSSKYLTVLSLSPRNILQFWACLLEIFDSSELVSSKYLTALSLSPRNIWQFWACLLEIFDSSELVSSKYLTVLSLSPRNIWQFWACLLEIFAACLFRFHPQSTAATFSRLVSLWLHWSRLAWRTKWDNQHILGFSLLLVSHTVWRLSTSYTIQLSLAIKWQRRICICIRTTNKYFCTHCKSRSQWPCGLGHRSAAARLLRLWLWIPLGA